MIHEPKPPAPLGPCRTLESMGVAELEALRLILRGGSVIDWRRLHFQGPRRRWTASSGSTSSTSRTRATSARLRAVLAQAVEYLRSAFGYRVAAPVAEPDDLRDLFLLACGVAEPGPATGASPAWCSR